ncbi:MAG: hypothetical protein ABW195_08945 [Ilumatobacteraceae bacterium]
MTDPRREVLDLPPWAPVLNGPAPERRAVVAAFDVDGTMTTRDSVVPFLRRGAGTGRLAAVPARATSTGRPMVEIEAAAAAFATRTERDLRRPETVACLRWHHAADQLLGGHCRGPAEVDRLHAGLDEHHGVWARGPLGVVPGPTT